jgi:hypothetical protein
MVAQIPSLREHYECSVAFSSVHQWTCARAHWASALPPSDDSGGHLGDTGEVQRRQRLGGMLNYYYRAAA